jgi:ribosomal protein RSM22 (predicted rRNA methylase)
MDRYEQDPALLHAYALYYMPQTFVRIQMILGELLATGRWHPNPARGPVRILDLGTGTGAASLATVAALPGIPSAITAVDHSGPGLAILQSLFDSARELWPLATLATQPMDMATGLPPGEWDLILASFSLNELAESSCHTPSETIHAWLNHLAAGGLLVVCEPATREAAQRLQVVRDHARTHPGIQVVLPCLHQAPCPMRNRSDCWCHEVRRWTAPSCVEQVNRALHRQIQFLKFSCLALDRPHPGPVPPRDSNWARLVSPMEDGKGVVRAFGCAADSILRHYEFQTRGLSRRETKQFLAIERGDTLHWPAARVLGDGSTWRVDQPPTVGFGFAD